MKIPQTLIAVVALLSIAGSAGAETPKVERKVGSDGVPVISIKGDKPAPPTRVEEAEEVAPARKPFKVYELDREEEAADNKPTIVVVGNPPPIAPSAGYGYGYGYAPSPYYSGYNGFYNSGFYNTGFYNTRDRIGTLTWKHMSPVGTLTWKHMSYTDRGARSEVFQWPSV